MNIVLACVIGVLYACALYMMLQRSIVRLMIGLAILSNAANLLVFTASGLTRGKAPLIPEDGLHTAVVSDPLPQALILTAIVIGFGVLAFAISLIQRAFETAGTDDLDSMKATDR
jgi:multicomponent Na+:H+ antiporter subunit C